LQKEVLIGSAQFMSAVLTKEADTVKPLISIGNVLKEAGFLHLCSCDFSDLTKWLLRIALVGLDCSQGVDILNFAWKLVDMKRWEGWFTQNERTSIGFLALIRGLQRTWKCIADDVSLMNQFISITNQNQIYSSARNSSNV
jgi:hypothetical protein